MSQAMTFGMQTQLQKMEGEGPMSEIMRRWLEAREAVAQAEQEVRLVEQEAQAQGEELWITLALAAEILSVTPKTMSVYAKGSKESQPIVLAKGAGLGGIEVEVASLRAEMDRRAAVLAATTEAQMEDVYLSKEERAARRAERAAKRAARRDIQLRMEATEKLKASMLAKGQHPAEFIEEMFADQIADLEKEAAALGIVLEESDEAGDE